MYDKSISQTEKLLKTNAERGISQNEAERRIAEFGENKTEQKKSHGVIYKFFSQFSDLMIIILLIAAALSLGIALYNGSAADLIEPLIIVAIVIVNAALGTIQEYRAEKSLKALEKLSSPKTKVVRNGEIVVVDSNLLAVGDLCLFEAGDVVTADCRLVRAEGLAVNESALTGESTPVEKSHKAAVAHNAALSERANCVYGGSFVTSGRCSALVFATGKNTEMGKIAGLLQSSEQTKTPLQLKMKQLSKVIGVVCLAVCALVLVVGFVKGVRSMRQGDTVTGVFVNVFLTSVSLAVAAIPEGLPAVVTIVLARGVERMAKRNAVVKTLPAVEALGSATVICSDKTGTLTQNSMTLEGIYYNNRYIRNNFGDAAYPIKMFAACCDAVENGDGQWLGDPTEIAVVRIADKTACTRLFEIPFDSDRKMMTVVVRTEQGDFAVTKGSFEAMSTHADNALQFSERYALCTHRGLRVLALSVTPLGNRQMNDALECDLHIIALFSVVDPPRPEASQAVATCVEAGIRPVMITGDNVDTAREIATQLGIMRSGDIAVDGATLASWDERTLEKEISRVAVFARVSPADKLRIVKAWQNCGAVVAMTGDGVNDAPALKAADIGCAMGSGTEVAKNSADMILTDDNFATIVDAVEEGRGVYDNIKKSVRYLLSCNIGEVLSVFVALLIWNVAPLGAMQLLWINLVTDGLPSLAISVGRRGKSVMSLPPKRKDETFFSNGAGKRIAFGGLMFAAITLVAYAIGNAVDGASAATMAFLVLSLSQLFYALEVDSRKTLLTSGASLFTAASFAISAALVAVVAFVPALRTMFQLSALSAPMYLEALALALVPMAVCELRYAFAAGKRQILRKTAAA